MLPFFCDRFTDNQALRLNFGGFCQIGYNDFRDMAPADEGDGTVFKWHGSFLAKFGLLKIPLGFPFRTSCRT
jgi:hypothetical protein